jgi:hypothetical protein
MAAGNQSFAEERQTKSRTGPYPQFGRTAGTTAGDWVAEVLTDPGVGDGSGDGYIVKRVRTHHFIYL